jgi:hypothetical protein
MRLLDGIRNALQPPAHPAGNPAEFAKLREVAYGKLFDSDPVRVFPHDLFQMPRCGGKIEVRIYDLPYERKVGQVQVAITSGMSDYRMGETRREVIQYFRECRVEDIARLHGVAWVPLASGFSLDFFDTAGPIPSEWPASLFLPSLVKEHAGFKLMLDDDELRLLWHVPLRQEELDFKLRNGVNALLKRMQEVQLPWIFDANNRPSLV